MNQFGLEFHHFGLAVREPETAGLYLTALGYQKENEVFDPLQGVNLAIYTHASMPSVEVIWPGPAPSPVDNLIKRRDGLVYHLCYTTKSVENSLQAMETADLRVVQAVEPRSAILFNGTPVSFYHVAGFGLIELIHS